MNRRNFLQSAIVATLAVDPERLLWTPKKTIFIPPVYRPRVQPLTVKAVHDIMLEMKVKGYLIDPSSIKYIIVRALDPIQEGQAVFWEANND